MTSAGPVGFRLGSLGEWWCFWVSGGAVPELEKPPRAGVIGLGEEGGRSALDVLSLG